MRHLLLLLVLAPGLARPAAAQSNEIGIGSVLAPLPPGAQVVPHPHGQSRFGGTRVRLEERLTVEVAVLPASATTLEAYVDSLAQRRNEQLRPSWQLEPARAFTVAGRMAWVLQPRCGDCEAVEVYLDFPDTRLVVAWGVDGQDGLTAAERHAIAWRFVASLHPVQGAS